MCVEKSGVVDDAVHPTEQTDRTHTCPFDGQVCDTVALSVEGASKRRAGVPDWDEASAAVGTLCGDHAVAISGPVQVVDDGVVRTGVLACVVEVRPVGDPVGVRLRPIPTRV